MNRLVFFICLPAAIMTAMMLSPRESRAPGPTPGSAREPSFSSAPPPVVPVEIFSAAPAEKPGPKSMAPPVDSPASASVPANLPALDIERELSGITATNPVAALEMAAQLDPAQHPGVLMEDLIQQWASSDPLAAAAWAKLNTDGEEQSLLLQRVGFVLSQSDPVDAAEFVQTEMTAGPVQDEAIMTVVNQWGNRDLAAAAAWVKTFPEGPLQQRAVIELEGIENYRQALAASQN